MRPKILFTSLFLIAMLSQVNAQKNDLTLVDKNLTGVWQYNTRQISDALQPTFHFFQNGTFIYFTSGYDGLNPLRSFSGKYYVKGGGLYMKILSIKIKTQFNIVESNPGINEDPFKIQDGKYIEIVQNKQSFDWYELEFIKNQKDNADKSIIKINQQSYYKIASDPNKTDF